jgi:uroporphyrinogen decarboxylase
MLMGFDNFCMSLYENYSLVKKVFEKVGSIQFEVFKNIIATNSVGAIAAVDDIAYSEGLMISSSLLRDNLFPWYKKMGKICRKNQIPFIYHSDGNIMEIIDDLIDCGFTAIHPVEEKAMRISSVYNKYKDKLCLLGNIDMDILIRCNPEDVENLVLNNLKNLAPDGFYCCGSGNSVTKSIPVENYTALVRTTRRYGKYPII